MSSTIKTGHINAQLSNHNMGYIHTDALYLREGLNDIGFIKKDNGLFDELVSRVI